MSKQAAFIERETREWAEFITYQLAREMSKQRGMTISRQEIFSIQRAVVHSAKKYGHEVGFQFADAGRYIDMKNIRYRGSGHAEKGREFLEVLQDWVGRKGLGTFNHAPGYDRRMPVDQEQAIKRIALGIFFNRMQGGMKHKRKKWWSHVLYGGLGNLYGRLRYGFEQEAIGAIKKMDPKNQGPSVN